MLLSRRRPDLLDAGFHLLAAQVILTYISVSCGWNLLSEHRTCYLGLKHVLLASTLVREQARAPLAKTTRSPRRRIPPAGGTGHSNIHFGILGVEYVVLDLNMLS